nr:MAG TPA_asm: hypothetical protein [Caudoviricetes sp.]
MIPTRKGRRDFLVVPFQVNAALLRPVRRPFFVPSPFSSAPPAVAILPVSLPTAGPESRKKRTIPIQKSDLSHTFNIRCANK